MNKLLSELLYLSTVRGKNKTKLADQSPILQQDDLN